MSSDSAPQKPNGISWSAYSTHLKQLLDRLPEDIRIITRELSNLGWYQSRLMEFKQFMSTLDMIRNNDLHSVDKLMFEWWRNNYHMHLEIIYTKFPHRKQPISEAITAHVNSNFYLSTPVLLIQAEGICIDLFGEKLYSTENGIPKVASKIEKRRRLVFSTAMQELMAKPTALTAKSVHRSKYPNAINRHEILHGIDHTYGTEANSLKAISFLCHCTDVLPPRVGD